MPPLRRRRYCAFRVHNNRKIELAFTRKFAKMSRPRLVRTIEWRAEQVNQTVLGQAAKLLLHYEMDLIKPGTILTWSVLAQLPIPEEEMRRLGQGLFGSVDMPADVNKLHAAILATRDPDVLAALMPWYYGLTSSYYRDLAIISLQADGSRTRAILHERLRRESTPRHVLQQVADWLWVQV